MLETTPVHTSAPEPAQMLGADASSVMPTEQPIFAARSRRRARAVNAAGGALAVFIVLWLVALVGGGTGFVHLPAWRTAVAAAPRSAHRVARVRRPTASPAHLTQATLVLHAIRHRRGVRS